MAGLIEEGKDMMSEDAEPAVADAAIIAAAHALPTPLDDPFDVAEAILGAATSGKRAIKVSGPTKLNTALARFAPAVRDRMAAMQMDRQLYEEPPRDPRGSLFEPGRTGSAYGSGGARAR